MTCACRAQYTCIENGEGKFARALLVSSRVASTMGFDSIHPDPDCGFLNFCVMCQASAVRDLEVNALILLAPFGRRAAERGLSSQRTRSLFCVLRPERCTLKRYVFEVMFSWEGPGNPLFIFGD